MHVDRHTWPRLSALLDEALELAPAQLSDWLTTQSALQPDIAEVLRELLARRTAIETGDFMMALPAIPGLDSASGDGAAAGALRSGDHVGPYLLERQIGQGGAGTVWLAAGHTGDQGDSQHSVRRRAVALKLIQAGAYGIDVLERFARERDILASLEHPHIARLYDAGIAAKGQPYLALEYVEGLPLDAYCDQHQLSLRARLLLFRQVLEAVAFAHSRLVIHRDLKPTNILVTVDGKVRLLDFGVAKLLRQPQAAVQAPTEITARFMTPRYAAPEQITGQAMTTATDVYSLGVVLYELLTACSPYRTTRASRGALEEAIVEVEPLAPSRAIAPANASARATTLARLQAALRGDLDTIVLKSLKKVAADRYATVDALLLDIDNYLAGVPVLARGDSAWYRLRKFVNRNRTVTALTAALLLALLLGIAGVGWQAVRAREAAARAELEARREKATKEFLISVFSAVDPRLLSEQPRASIPAGELLSMSGDRIEKDFASDPDTGLQLLGMVTEILNSVDDMDRYRPLHERYVQLLIARYGELDPRSIGAMLEQADALLETGETGAAAALVKRTDELIDRAGLQQSKTRALWWLTRADLLRGESAVSAERADALQRAIALYSQVAPIDENYARALSALGGLRYRQDDDDAAIALARRAGSVLRASKGPEYAELGALYVNLAGAEEEKGDFTAAFVDYARASSILRKTYGPQSRRYVAAAAEEARLQHRRGLRQRADGTFAQLLELSPLTPAVYADASLAQSAAVIREDYGECLVAEGRASLAIPLLLQALQIYNAKALFSDYRDAFAVHLALGTAYADLGRHADAERELRVLVAHMAATKSADYPMLLAARERWGRLLGRRGNPGAAQAQLQAVLDQGHERNIAPVARAYSDLADLAASRGQPLRALQLSNRALQIAERDRSESEIRLGPLLWSRHASVLLRGGDAHGAVDWAQRAVTAERDYDDPASPELISAESTLRSAQQAAQL